MVGVAKDSITGELLFDEFVSIQKELFDAIQIPYRVIEVPADDLGEFFQQCFHSFLFSMELN